MRGTGAKGNATNGIDGLVENGISHKNERLPTIQIDTVPSPPWSPAELSPVEDGQEEPIDEEQIDLNLEEQPSESLSEELRESLRSYVEDILSQAMGVAEKKLKFVGLDDDDEEDEEGGEEAAPPPPDVEEAPPQDDDEEEEDQEEAARKEEEIRSAAQRVVEEVISQATETVAARLEEEHNHPMTFDEAPDDVKEVASNFVKEIVGRAITLAEEKSAPTTVPFNFEDVDLMKTSGPWYVRVREALLRVLRSACFCTPRRNDS